VDWQIKDNLRAYNSDGREFIHKAITDLDLAMNGGDKWKTFDHFVMNLPATGIEFLGKLRVVIGSGISNLWRLTLFSFFTDAFRGAYRSKKSIYEQSGSPKLPMVHCHCFSKSPTPNSDIMEVSYLRYSYVNIRSE
jgi:tRNA (guanine37-N1)-methyltransferase